MVLLCCYNILLASLLSVPHRMLWLLSWIENYKKSPSRSRALVVGLEVPMTFAKALGSFLILVNSNSKP